MNFRNFQIQEVDEHPLETRISFVFRQLEYLRALLRRVSDVLVFCHFSSSSSVDHICVLSRDVIRLD
jgi:hypothetical protein